jgi:nucleotide-binding universal stress UspA family protein
MFAEAVHNGSDLLVIGAYSHARWRELLFGGTTRTLLTETLVPVLVSK